MSGTCFISTWTDSTFHFVFSLFLIPHCSDGLWDVLDDQQAVDMVWELTDDPENVAKHLVKEALARGSMDNISVVVAWL